MPTAVILCEIRNIAGGCVLKGIKLFVLGCAGAAICAISSLAEAAVPYSFGWYLEGNVGRSASYQILPGKVKDTGLGFNINGGYKFTKYVAVDVGFTNYAQTRIRNSAGTTVATDSHFSYDIAGKFMLPIVNTGLEVFAKAGVSRIHSYVSVKNQGAANLNGLTFNTGMHSATGAYFGLGGDYAILQNLLANVQWMRASGKRATGRADLYSAGLSYIF
jgi:hypothetical protein